MQQATPLDALLRRDRLIVLAGIVAVAALAWAHVVYRSQRGDDATGMGMGMDAGMAHLQTWGAADFGFMFLMWAVMMAAMMVPSAAPMILLFATVNRKRREQQRPYVPTGVFLLGYIAVWCGFALAATLANWGLHANSLLSSMMGESSNAYLGGALLISAGLFQWSRLKYVCLTHCRSPIGFLMSDWREGTGGALKMGLRHGTFCVGCCWVLMALLFVLGVMNLLWIAALAGFVLLEKAVPGGQRVGRLTGVLLAGWGAWMVLSSIS